MREEFKNIDITQNPRLILGWREPRRRLDALRVRLNEDVFEELSALCTPALKEIQHYQERPYERFAALDDEEYFWYEHSRLRPPTTKVHTRKSSANGSHDATGADLVRLVQGVDGLSEISRSRLSEGSFSFYAICWDHHKKIIGFVSHVNPILTLKTGVRFFLYGDTMQAVAHPDFSLTSGSDLFVGLEGTAILNPSAFATLLGDADLTTTEVKTDLTAVKRALTKSIALSTDAESALEHECNRTVKYAKRLHALPDRLKSINLNSKDLRTNLRRHHIDANLILDEKERFHFNKENVDIFFDAIDSRYFEDDFTPEKRRADRYSKRVTN